MLHSTWLLMELAAERMRQELRDAEAARRARLAEETFRPPGRARGGRGVVFAVWGAVRGAAYAVARTVR